MKGRRVIRRWRLHHSYRAGLWGLGYGFDRLTLLTRPGIARAALDSGLVVSRAEHEEALIVARRAQELLAGRDATITRVRERIEGPAHALAADIERILDGQQ